APKCPAAACRAEQSADPTPLLRRLPPSRGSSEGIPRESTQHWLVSRIVLFIQLSYAPISHARSLGSATAIAAPNTLPPQATTLPPKKLLPDPGTGDPPNSCPFYREISTGSRRAPQVPTGPSKTPGSSVPHRSQWPDS